VVRWGFCFLGLGWFEIFLFFFKKTDRNMFILHPICVCCLVLCCRLGMFLLFVVWFGCGFIVFVVGLKVLLYVLHLYLEFCLRVVCLFLLCFHFYNVCILQIF
jgi:hypothetical protein